MRVVVSLGKTLNATFPILEPNSLPVVVVQPDKRHANRNALGSVLHVQSIILHKRKKETYNL